jgi:CBS domain-containing protein
LFGGVSQIEEEPKSAKDEFRMAVVGPLSSLFLAFVFGILWYFVLRASGAEVISAVIEYLALINFMLFAFNLLPGFPLDGGRILRAYFWNKTKNMAKATSIASTTGKGLGLFLILLGAFEAISGYIIGGVWMIFIGLFLRQAAQSSYQKVLIMDVLSGIKVKELMTPNVVCVNPDVSISDMVDQFFFKHRFNSFPVCQKDRFLGIVTLNSIRQIPKESWREKRVGSVVKSVPEEFVLGPDSDAVDALKKIIQSDLGRLPVVEEGKLVGILTRKDIMDLLRIKIDLGRSK